jgi:hypothetical protein
MTEKTLSMEIHPMRGHSRGEWYCSMDDVAPSAEEAEYWAIFGVTHRGNRHCLGEFPTQQAANRAANGWGSVGKPARPTTMRNISRLRQRQVNLPHGRHGKNVIQMEVVSDPDDDSRIRVYALCENGTIWRRDADKTGDAGPVFNAWERVPAPANLTPEEAFRLAIEKSI